MFLPVARHISKINSIKKFMSEEYFQAYFTYDTRGLFLPDELKGIFNNNSKLLLDIQVINLNRNYIDVKSLKQFYNPNYNTYLILKQSRIYVYKLYSNCITYGMFRSMSEDDIAYYYETSILIHSSSNECFIISCKEM